MQYAVFSSTAEVLEGFKEAYTKEISRQAAEVYNAGKILSRKALSDELVELFDETRQAYKLAIEDIPIANKAFRMQEFQKIYDRAFNGKTPNLVLAQSVLVDAAKEAGDAHTNKVKLEHTGKDGTAIQVQDVPMDLSKLTTEQVETLLPISEALHGGAHPNPAPS